MKRYFRIGLGVIIPVALVLQVGLWLVQVTNGFFNALLGIELTWWGVLASLAITVALVAILGFIVAHSKLVRNIKAWVEKQIIERTPIVRPLYNFGKEVVDTFAGDLKSDKDLQVVEVDFGGFKALGVLTDEQNSIGFLLSAPSPLTGVVLKLPNYKKLDMTFVEAAKVNTSLGRVGGDKWQ